MGVSKDKEMCEFMEESKETLTLKKKKNRHRREWVRCRKKFFFS